MQGPRILSHDCPVTTLSVDTTQPGADTAAAVSREAAPGPNCPLSPCTACRAQGGWTRVRGSEVDHGEAQVPPWPVPAGPSAPFFQHPALPAHHFLVSWLPSHPLPDCRGKRRSHWQDAAEPPEPFKDTEKGICCAAGANGNQHAVHATHARHWSVAYRRSHVRNQRLPWLDSSQGPALPCLSDSRPEVTSLLGPWPGREAPPWSLHWIRWPRGPHGTVTLLPQNGHWDVASPCVIMSLAPLLIFDHLLWERPILPYLLSRVWKTEKPPYPTPSSGALGSSGRVNPTILDQPWSFRACVKHRPRNHGRPFQCNFFHSLKGQRRQNWKEIAEWKIKDGEGMEE